MEKINYQEKFKQIAEEVRKLNKKPKLLLHACCGPCFTLPYEEIKDLFDITIIYNNSNIYPEEEYLRRLNELKHYAAKKDSGITIIEIPYNNEEYNQDLEPFKDVPEGGKRCEVCFRKRLSFGYQYASEHNFDYFGTVMTISRYKNAQVINQIGKELEEQFPNVKWLYADYKKENGYQKSLAIVKEENMYFQDYCGCKYSYEVRQQKKLEKNEK